MVLQNLRDREFRLQVTIQTGALTKVVMRNLCCKNLERNKETFYLLVINYNTELAIIFVVISRL